MKFGLPEGHGLPPELLASGLLHRDEFGEYQLTDVQYAALEAGVASGTSILAVAPTSSGKTDVGLFAAASWLHRGLADGARVAFLTSHRALARQKFEELRRRFAPLFTLAPTEIVLATGDDVIDGNGDAAVDAFAAPVLIATYEKYLNMLAGSGLHLGAANTCLIADEIQLIGDVTRGQNVEILMTLLRQSVGQIVGLSAVLERHYATQLSEWLGAELVFETEREIELFYELRTSEATYETSTRSQDGPERLEKRVSGTLEILKELLREGATYEPIAVFCMTKKQVFDLAEAWAVEAGRLGATRTEDLPLFREPTTSSEELGRYLPHRFAYHTADLNEDERVAVETRLDSSTLRVVFATTTLAAGLNYSFRTVIIHSWRRWDSRTRSYVPIQRSEFHNMAGRAGRLSHVDTPGRVIYFAADGQEARAAGRYLSWWELDEFAPRIDPVSFSPLALQLFAANVVDTDDSLCAFLQNTFSAERELERNPSQPQIWRQAVTQSLSELRNWGFVA
ncbi:DEAD/DEAH box helicase [Sphingopyxis sp. MG]|uniref:DEAD/DEAH box helicase n=1 Tax=Sphingopyxis sp. MG TaxID=1866325 RepID=UPI000CDF4CD5|nr:DEAD/DEAH box helicase [Sphingopyxis sp. MG]AVA13754.1 DEAD/DEAH box helicase [Sphingopyxis sp. MG]